MSTPSLSSLRPPPRGRPILDVARELGLDEHALQPFGRGMAKVDPGLLAQPRARKEPARLVLVSAITPTPAGEGKTTTSIGLAQALRRSGRVTSVALREPSLGPCMGVKGGGTGGGACQLVPGERINLHFTGDLHAVTAAHNLLAALLDNHLHQGNARRIDPRRVLWPRVLDMNDRALRHVILGLGGPTEGVPREASFDITAASEVMATLCLATSEDDLKARLARILVAYDTEGAPVTAGDLEASGAMAALLQDALWPNLVQTSDGCPAFVHGGPFANIAHGCNSVLATRLALHQSDWVVTEAGFGFDLGAEKFFHVKAPVGGLDPAVVVLVATCRALKMHGGVKLRDLERPDLEAVRRGLANLEKHVENAERLGKPVVVALNRFDGDSPAEHEVVLEACRGAGLPCALAEHFARGAEGAAELAELVVATAERGGQPFRPVYRWEEPITDKIEALAREIYGASGVEYSLSARRAIRAAERHGFGNLPVCVAKTPRSLSDDPKLLGRPQDFHITVREIEINAGAGFLVVLTADLTRMPGLPKQPLARDLDLVDGQIIGLH